MFATDAKKRASRKYEAEKYCKLTIGMTPAQREQINEYCKDKGGTATYIKKLLREDMQRNGIRPLEANEEYVKV